MTYTFSIAFHWLGPLNTPSCVWDSLSYVLVGFPGGSVVKNQPASAEASGDVSSIPGWGRCPGEENGTLLQYGQRSLAGYSLFDCKESDTTEVTRHTHHSNLRDTGSPLDMNLRVGTFTDVNVHLHVESRKLVHVSGVHCHVHPSLSFCFCVLHCTVLYSIQ